MDLQEKQEWLDNLKVGDKVVIRTRYVKHIKKVEKITKTRRIYVENGLKFNSDGTQYGRTGAWDFNYIEPVTEELILEFKISRLVREIEDVNWNLVNYANLKKVADVLGIKN